MPPIGNKPIKLWQILIDDNIKMNGHALVDIGQSIDIVNDINFGPLNTTITVLSKMILQDTFLSNSISTLDPVTGLPGPEWKLGQLTDEKVTISVDDTVVELPTEQWIRDNSYYRHIQLSPASSWIIQHDMGIFPNVFIIEDDNGIHSKVFGDINYIDNNNLVINFSEDISGYAILTNHYTNV